MKNFLACIFALLGISSNMVKAQTIPQFPQTAEFLQSFGFKTTWYMVTSEELVRKNLSIPALAKRLKLQQQQTLSWNQGFEWHSKNYFAKRQSCFITPALHDWVYITCSVSDELDLLEGIVDNYYGFSSYRVVSAVAWKIVTSGKTERYFTYANGQIYHNEGKQTLAEKQLGIVDLSGLDNDTATDRVYADIDKNEGNPNYLSINDEENPVKLCEILTGQNPLKFENLSVNEVTGTGIVGFLPN